LQPYSVVDASSAEAMHLPGSILAIAAASHLLANILSIHSTLAEGDHFRALAEGVEGYREHFQTALSIVVAIDLSIIAHGVFLWMRCCMCAPTRVCIQICSEIYSIRVCVQISACRYTDAHTRV
jgi:hypothetical protein